MMKTTSIQKKSRRFPICLLLSDVFSSQKWKSQIRAVSSSYHVVISPCYRQNRLPRHYSTGKNILLSICVFYEEKTFLWQTLFASKTQTPEWRLKDGNPQKMLGNELSHSDQLEETSPSEDPVRGPTDSLDRD